MIFLSYATEQRDIAEKIAYALGNAGHEVFFDRNGIKPSDDYNTVIRAAIERSELLVFCISPEAVAKGSYALTELEMARAHFGKAVERVLPVMVVPTPWADIPNFPKSVSVLEPPGDVVAATLFRIHVLLGSWKKWRAWLLMSLGGVLAASALYQWTAPRLESDWVLALLAALLVVVAPLARWYWRLEVSATRLVWLGPLMLCVTALAAIWAAGVFRPMVVWLVPGSTLLPLMPADARPSAFTMELNVGGQVASIEDFGHSGAVLGTNAIIAELARREGEAAALDAMHAYLQQRVQERYFEAYIDLWRGSTPVQLDLPMFRNDSIRDAEITQGGQAFPVVLNSSGTFPLRVVFVEMAP